MEQEGKGKAERLFSDLGKKIDEIFENTKENKETLKSDLKEKFEDLKKSKEKLETEFEEFRSNKDGKWTKVRLHLDNALKEIKEAIDSVSKKSKSN